jgi:hypothetical protein
MKFVSLVMHSGPVTEAGIAPAVWPPPGADPSAEDQGPPPEPSAKQQADDELFFLRMLKPFTRYRPQIDQLRTGGPRVVVGVGADTGEEIAGRAARALADRLGAPASEFPGDHGGFMAEPAGFAAAIRRVLAESD